MLDAGSSHRENDLGILSTATPLRGAYVWDDGALTLVILSTATPLRGAYVWDDGALTLVILSERVRERVEGSPPVQRRAAREDALP
jgi:hypothetical protein